jgi:hypothetical protein
MPRLADLDAPAHIKHVRIQFATIAVRICSYSIWTNCGGTPCQRANISGDADTATTQVWRRIRCDTLERHVDFLSGACNNVWMRSGTSPLCIEGEINK